MTAARRNIHKVKMHLARTVTNKNLHSADSWKIRDQNRLWIYKILNMWNAKWREPIILMIWKIQGNLSKFLTCWLYYAWNLKYIFFIAKIYLSKKLYNCNVLYVAQECIFLCFNFRNLLIKKITKKITGLF